MRGFEENIRQPLCNRASVSAIQIIYPSAKKQTWTWLVAVCRCVDDNLDQNYSYKVVQI
jgi:hypothetical protein